MCDRFIHFMDSQKDIIDHHIDKHAWCQHIEDKNKAILDFIEKFGWVMRDSYCHCCPDFKKDNRLCEEYVESLR